MSKHISIEQIRRGRAIVDATYYPDGNLPSTRVLAQLTEEDEPPLVKRGGITFPVDPAIEDAFNVAKGQQP